MSSRPCDAGFDRLGRASADDLAAARALRDAARRLAAHVTWRLQAGRGFRDREHP